MDKLKEEKMKWEDLADIIPPHRFLMLADYLDKIDQKIFGYKKDEVQKDLRRFANAFSKLNSSDSGEEIEAVKFGRFLHDYCPIANTNSWIRAEKNKDGYYDSFLIEQLYQIFKGDKK